MNSQGQVPGFMQTATFSVHDLPGLVGREHVSPWVEVPQEDITRFAELTRDGQWIHTDPERARRESPFGATVAHGFHTLSLVTTMMAGAVGRCEDVKLGVNYGLNKVRFPSPVTAGSRVRGRLTLQRVDRVDGGLQATWGVIVECEGGAKPCCAAEWLVRYYL
jgi:acyl dehydratase